jgi:C-terminal processing protease CtpA/Prc
VGYLAFHAFLRGSEPLLRERMAQFRRERVTDLILDLRYNLGGDLETMKVLANLLCTRDAAGTVMLRQAGNGRRPDVVTPFQPEAEAPYPLKLACIVSEQSASASEALINALLPSYQGNLAMVGRRTAGKPVVCSLVPIPGTDLTLVLVTARALNAQGQGDYWDGLPFAGFLGATCAAADNLAHAPGDPREASTRAALDWIQSGGSALGPVR